MDFKFAYIIIAQMLFLQAKGMIVLFAFLSGFVVKKVTRIVVMIT